MVPEIENLKTWEEAETWLARHGYGLTQIAQIKDQWEAPVTKVAETVKAKVEPVKTAEPVTSAKK